MTTAEIWGSGMYNFLLEHRIQGKIYSLLYWHLGLPAHQTRVIMSLRVQADEALWDLLLAAADGGVIPKDGVGEVLAADLLLRARLPDSTEQVHVAVEVSRTVGNDDITRARERADLLAAAAGTQGRAVVIGAIIPEPQRERAAALGVALFQEED